MKRRILVAGGSGFVGRHVVAKLVAAGHSVIVPTRRRERAKDLLPLPTADIIQVDVHDRETLQRLVRRVDCVVNCVGILNEAGPHTFDRVHVELVASLIEACERAGVRRFVHVSAVGASPNAPSRYLRSKAEGEDRIVASRLAWTIFAPSVVYGRGDSFLTMFARLLEWLPFMALAAPTTRFQPIWVQDVAHCCARAVDDDRTIGHRYELGGPRVYTLREIVAWVGETTGHVRPIIPLGPTLSRLQAVVFEHLPGKLITRDTLASMSVDYVTQASFPTLFGIAPAALEAVAPEIIAPRSVHSRYEEFRAHSGR
ncbi:MAG TPA: complex I NDUFA9 subunit family protein [Casimicrobiaceae bacterium]|nr:complex I NDUFA9 subunit family protein [Casimicrobiaceae bacterium]